MKINMKLLAAIGSAALIALSGCTRVSDLEDRIEEVEGRVDALETLCLKLNTDITALQTLVQSQTEANIYISNVEDVENGYKITFSNGKTYVIQDGDKGSKGDKGEEGAAPVVSVRQDTDGGYYWTLNGEWLLVDGNKVSALGVTPQLRINSEAGNWEVSYDGGTTWTTVAAAYDKSHEITISQDDNAVYFKLADGTVFTVNKAIAYKFFVEQTEGIAIVAGATVELAYTVADADESVKFSVQCGGGYSASVVPSSVSAGVIKVTAPATLPTEGGYVLIIATKNSTGDVKAQQLSFEKGVINASEVNYTANAEGGNVNIPVSTNLQYTVDIPEAAQSWISVAPATRAVRLDTVTLVVSQNIGAARSATVTLKPNMGEPVSLTIAQAAASGVATFEVDKTAAEVAGNVTTYTIKLTSTVNWTVSASNGVTVTPASGAGNADIVMTFAANSSLDNKVTHTATITTDNSDITEKTITVTVTQGQGINANDYYAAFQRGEDISINGKTYNKNDYSARVISADKLADGNELVKSAATDGILFIDDNANSTITITGRSHIMMSDAVIIGRYRNSQPTIDAGSLNICPVGGEIVFKNVRYTSSNGFGFLFNNGRNEVHGNCSVIMEDCTINGSNTSSNSNAICRDANAAYSFEKLVFNNCVIVTPRPIVIHYTTDKTANTNVLSLVKITNSAMALPDGANFDAYRMILQERNAVELADLDILLDGNTFFGLTRSPIIPIKVVKSVNVTNNVFAAKTLTKNINVIGLDKEVKSTSAINYNVFASPSSGFNFGSCNSATKGYGVVGTPNTALESLPFTKTDFANGYMPIDKTLVTDGAGCDYSTKLWKSWE